ncbi:dihydrofolate reductase-like domain-containing protein [Phascolomyces articulosus]|uniref:2,5-diamino-6-ribosylamino-4(3H)-pyrimidinone 5'-phosphate reductase n=1 Tax=Phascolomyces articulosus TaxID=60185 RepID=A0AAD5K9N2_9FUNG|nr:dihydrofolate reductase-like domain-containing protein [Phascolomyces articulosus]
METRYVDAKEFLDTVYTEWLPSNESRPFVTLTYAQSLDGMISKKGEQLLLSGSESMAMTHRLRLLHDGILVGIGTARIDNPQLNARHVIASDLKSHEQPRPIVLDNRLELPLDCKLLKNFQNGTGRKPWIVTTASSSNPAAKALKEAGAHIIYITGQDHHRPTLKSVFETLKRQGITRLMVEGGAKIIQSCLDSGCLDHLIVTIAPMFVGEGGIKAGTYGQKLINVKYRQFGQDMVLSANTLTT